MMIRDILVLGGGSAGFLSALTLKKRFPDMSVTVLRSKDIGIIGVGEGTTIPVANHLHSYLGIDYNAFHRTAQPTWKLGIRFLKWGPRPYFDFPLGRQLDITYPGMSRPIGYYVGDTADFGMCSAMMTYDRVYPRRFDGVPYITRDVAYHIENDLLVAFLEKHAVAQGIAIRDDTVVEVKQNDAGLTGLVLESGQTATADLYLDCSGFRALLIGQALGEPMCSFERSLFCNRAVVGGWTREEEPVKPYTTGEAMNAGWCWQIEHEGHVNRGYVYSSSFISDEAADEEFRAKNPKVKNTRIVKFFSGRRQRSWVKNVVAIGNATGFVEPMEATALGMICLDSHALAEALADVQREVRPLTVRQYNMRFATMWGRHRPCRSAGFRRLLPGNRPQHALAQPGHRRPQSLRL
jgi:tryptophan halogenase